MRFPKPLPQGGTIGFLAPSCGCDSEPRKTAFDHALETFRSMGYRTVLGPNCYAASGVGISNTPEKCGKELTDSFLDPASDALISCGGGELMCEVIPHMDLDRIAAAPPKWYMGYSDNTNYVFLSATLCDTAAVYGPCAAAFGMEPWHPALCKAMEILTGGDLTVRGFGKWEKRSLRDEDHPLAPYNPDRRARYRLYDPRRGEKCRVVRTGGRLLGGCLDCLCNLVGTRFDKVDAFNDRYGDDGILWFLEACDLDPLGVRRAIWQLKEAGWFRRASGFLIGRPAHMGEEVMGLDMYEAVLVHLRDLGVPVLMDLDIGHLPPMMPLILGARAEAVCRPSSFEMKMMTDA